jgi:epoxyqueuosine reductase
MSFQVDKEPQAGPEQFIEDLIESFVRTSPLNGVPFADNQPIYDEPLIGFADGDDTIFTDYKTIIAPAHMTPREALAKTYEKSPEEMPSRLSVVCWVLPVAAPPRESNRKCKGDPSRLWASVEHYGEFHFLEAMCEHVVEALREAGHLAAAPAMEPYFKDTMMAMQIQGEEWDIDKIRKAGISNWSEKHIAYAAGLGTLSFSGNFISERGAAVHLGSVVTSLELPASPRSYDGPYDYCLFYKEGKCKACATRCPVGAITENGHDDIKCARHVIELQRLGNEFEIERVGCGMCMTKVPCEFRKPLKES